MSIIKQYHKDTKTTYVYESQYYYDKDKKQSRSRRKLIGKIDEETGQIVPTGKRGRKKKAPMTGNEPLAGCAGPDGPAADELQRLRARVGELENENILLRTDMESMEERYRKLLAEKDGIVRDLKSQVRKLEGSITKAKSSLEKAMGSLGDV